MPEAGVDFREAQPTPVRGFSRRQGSCRGWGQHTAGTRRRTRGRRDFGSVFWRRGLLGQCIARAARGRASVCTLLLPSEDPPRGKRSDRSPKGAEAARQTASPSATRPGARRFHTRAAALRCAMREHSAMSSLGKADAIASCLPSQCFDPLTRFCVRCSDLFKDNAKPVHVASTSAPPPTLPSVDLPSTLLIFGVPTLVVLLLVLAALCGLLACKARKQRRKSRKTEQEAKESLGETGPLPSPGYPDFAAPEGEVGPAWGPCPHLNGGLKAPGPPGRDSAKRRPCCQGDVERDVVLLAATWPHHEEHGHGFPLPATELGATALVTTKTTQDCMGEERP
ncbi:tumor necrosis factor receptor superfamily member 13C isoform X3 [Cygnus olor]|uniref:tumor necrosis factor receptor superfamily member 13C isoform X3 n=1 Tax=Cygnus olor TaxID=8869 RepID=UPI001ADE6568|nr:tumor necrosis factor receptor superfamily member 13C isoform X3 [Cygnus olor]